MVKNNLKFVLLFIASFFVNHFGQNLSNSQSLNTQMDFSTISVTIGGNFIVNGSFPASSLERVDHFVSRIFNEAKAQSIRTIPQIDQRYILEDEIKKFPLRNIKLIRVSGEEIIIDLEKFRLNGDFKFNPYLKNDDVIIFPNLDLAKNFIKIDGAVNNPKTFQFVEGDKLKDALELAQGIDNSYPKIESVELIRLSYDGNSEEIFTLSIDSDFDLLPGDRIKVVANETQKKDYKVLVLGEVNNPGFVNINKKGERIDEVITKAGGLLSEAWKEKIELYRGYYSNLKADQQLIYNEVELKKLETQKKFEELLMIRMANLFVYDTAYFNLENELRFFNKSGLISYSKMIEDTSDTYLIQDGDLIIVPKFKNTINIFGQVPHPGEYKFVEGKKYESYIEDAGGYGEYATDEVMLIKSISKNWIPIYNNEKVKIEPGDYIYIPKKQLRDFGFYLSRIGAIASIISAAATVVLLFKK